MRSLLERTGHQTPNDVPLHEHEEPNRQDGEDQPGRDRLVPGADELGHTKPGGVQATFCDEGRCKQVVVPAGEESNDQRRHQRRARKG